MRVWMVNRHFDLSVIKENFLITICGFLSFKMPLLVLPCVVCCS